MLQPLSLQPPPDLSELDARLRGRRVVVLSGAGCSTESGIPDYRGEGRRPRAPLQYGEFVRDPAARRRYWARSAVGWPRMRGAVPNQGHAALARLERAGAVAGVLTQNVDGLHQAAGSRRVVELHGSLSRVGCLGCGARSSRERMQRRLLMENPGWLERPGGPLAASAPDGDADLETLELERFRVPACEACGGVLKPDVVFFGENVPRGRLEEAWALFAEAEALLVVGSSLAVFSGRRFVLRAASEGVPVVVVNLGPTRADELASARVEGRLGEVLPRLAEGLLALPR